MARLSFRARGPTESRSNAAASRWCLALAFLPALGGCVSYEPAPVDVAGLLAGLEARRWESASLAPDRAEPGEQANPRQLASFAITNNPALRAARAEIGVAQALLVEAGLLADPEIGWDGMDALAAQLVEGTTSSVDFVSGFGLSIPLPRPGERDARKGAARWRIEEKRRRIAAAEWELARDVHLACEDVLEAARLLEQNAELVQIAETTRAFFARALRAGAATAIQANLATADALATRARQVRFEAGLRDARHRLNGLLGLSPETELPVASSEESSDPTGDEPLLDTQSLVERALGSRPDLAALLASYQAAEEELRLAVALQWPEVAVGTGIWLVPGFFTRFHRPAIATAMARREALRGEIEARVHAVRREIHAARAALEESRREVSFLEGELLPNAEESLRLTGQAFDAGEVTVLEILTVQRALIDARTRTTEARAELQRQRWLLLAACGTLLTADEADDERRDPER